ncbi:hypothetical protein FRC17_005225 [Serendipita sp. 399]|nr:hypothetical protein FRC17_005225 [Serendipita sp. 399]
MYACEMGIGFTEHVLQPVEGPTLPSKYSIGLTDLVTTPSHGFADISVQERKASVETLLCKIARFKPRVLALNSFAIWNDIASVLEKQLKPGRDVHGKSHRISGGGGGGGNTTAIGGRNPKEKEGRGTKVEEGRTELLSKVRLEPPLDSAEYPPLKLPQVSENRTPAFLPWKLVYEDSTVHETLIMPLPGTSGANASYSLSEKVSFFKAIHDKLPAIKRGEMDTSQMGRIVVSQDVTVA